MLISCFYQPKSLSMKSSSIFFAFLLSLCSAALIAQGWTQSPGCGPTTPTPLMFMINACPDNSNEAFNEYFMFQVGNTAYNVNGAGTSLSVSCPAGTINSQVNSFTSNATAVAQLNALVGACPSGNVFVDAMAPGGLNGNIPPNGIVMAFPMSSPNYSTLPAGYLSSLCGASPIYVIFGTYPGPIPMFKNYGCTACGCIRYISLSFGGCVYNVNYDVQSLTLTDGVTPGDADGAFINLQPGGQIGYGNDGGQCIPVAEFCTPPPAPVIVQTGFTICNGNPAPTFTCTNCDANSGWFTSEFGSTLLGSGTTFTPNPAPTTTTSYWVQNSTDCNSDRIQVTVTVNQNPTVSVSIPGGFTYCVGQSIALSAAGSSNVGPAPGYQWTISGPGGTVNATGVAPTITIPNAGTYSISLTVTNTVTGCFGTQNFNNILTINAAPPIFPAGPLTQCETAPGQATFDLTLLDNTITGGSGQPVTWFLNAGLTVQSASPSNQLITGGSTTVYAVINHLGPGCTSLPQAVSLVITPPTPVVIAPLGSICNNAAPLPLNTTQNGITGTWSGAGVSGNQFNPAGLAGNVTLTFGPGAGQCASSSSTTITVQVPAPVVINNAPPATVCNLAAPIALNTTQSGISGNWSGTGVSGNQFNPAGLSGNITLTFTPTAGQCALPNTATVNVTAAAAVVISNAPPATVCNLAAPIALNTTQSGISGNWSGTGVSGNQFNPAGLSGSIILTFTPTAGQCALPNTATVNVTAAAAVVISNAPPATVCSLAAPIALNATQSGISGNWSGTGVSGNQFNPAGFSGNITLTFTPTAGQCALPNTATVSVTAATPTAITAPPPNFICSNATVATLITTQSGINGTWSGTGVTGGNQFNPTGLSGAISLTFTPAAGQCALPNAANANVTAATPVVISNPPPTTLCSLADPIVLNTTQSGSTGAWSGTGVSGNLFDPAGLSGSFTLTFTPAPAAGQCALPNTATVNITPAAPVVISNPPPVLVCNTAGTVALNATQSGFAGSWAGTGVSGNVFNPSGIVAPSVTLTFTPDFGQCALPASVPVQINQPAAATLTDLPPAALCSSAAPVTLNPMQNGISGVWSGTGVVANVFDPSGIGTPTATLTFNPSVGQCVLPNTVTITITQAVAALLNSPPTATFCSADAPVALNTSQSGISGSWSGIGVSGNQFNPAGLSGVITLSFTPDAGQCALPNSTAVTVTATAPVPITNAPPATLCNTAAFVTLNPTQNGISGTWSGAGVSGGQFNPAGQSGSITLTFTPAASQCAQPNTFVIAVTAAAPITLSNPPANTFCNTDAPITLNTTQSGISGTWSGSGVSGNTFDPASLVGNSVLTFTPVAGQCVLPNTLNIAVLPAPNAATLPPAVAQLCNDAASGNATTIDLDDLVTGDTNGTWTTTAPAGSIGAGNVFNATGLPDNATYTLTYTVPGIAPCNTASTTQTISVITCSAGCTENAAFNPPAALCGSAGATLDLNTLLIAGTTTPGGTWTTNAPAGTLTGSVFNASGLSGAFTVTYTVNGAPGCPNLSANQNITVTAPPAATITAPLGALCNAAGSPTLNLSTLVVGNPALGNWSSPDAPAAITGNTFNPAGLTPGNYTLVYTVPATSPCANAATATQTITVGGNATNAGPDDAICGLTYNLSGFTIYPGTWLVVSAPSGAATAVFANPANIQTGVTVSETGVYIFAWTPVDDPCMTQDLVQITFTDNPNANAGPDAAACGNTFTLAASGTGLWSYAGSGAVAFDNPNSPTTQVLVSNTGVYDFTWTTGSGTCTASDVVTVTFSDALAVSANPVCSADLSNYTVTLTITGGTPPYLVNGTPIVGNTYTGTFVNNANYALSVSDSGGCPPVLASGTLNCTCPTVDTPVLNPFTDTVCQGQPLPTISVQPNATDAYTWLLNGVQVGFGNSFTPAAGGNYTVQATAPNGCQSALVPFTVTVQPNPLAPVLDPSYDFCAGTPPPVLVTATTGNTLEWTGSEAGTGTGFQPTVTASGIYLYTVTQVSAAGCQSAPIAVSVTLSNCACPAVQTISANQVACAGSEVNLSASVTTALNLDRVEWIAPNGAVIGTTDNLIIQENITDCTPQVFTYTYNVYCANDPAVVASSATVNVTWYPLPTAVITASPNGCMLTATPNCTDFLVAPSNVQTTFINGNTDAVTFTVISNEAALLGLPCSFTTYDANFDCNLSDCPFITGLNPGSETQVCSGAAYTLNLGVTNSVELASVNWTVNGIFVGGGQSIALTAPTVADCDPLQLTVAATITCTTDPGFADVATFTVTVFPEFNPANVLYTSDCINPPTATALCANYLLTPISVPAPVVGNNFATWQVTYAGSTCMNGSATYTYSCAAGACPQVVTPLAANLSVCSGDAPNFSALESSIVFSDPDGTANGFAWFADDAFTNPLTPDDYAHPGGCAVANFTVYAALLCTSGAPAPAGTLNLSVYPTPATVAPVGGCSLQVQDNCGNLLVIEYLQTDGTWSVNLPNPTPVFGETADWRAYVAGAPDNNGDGNPDCMQTGTVTAVCGCTPPTPPIPVTDNLTICEGQTNTAAFEATTVAGTYVLWTNPAGIAVADGLTYVPTTPGAYTAQAVLTGNNLCTSTAVTFTLTQLPQESAAFTYPSAQFCATDPAALPTISGAAGGTFTASGGLTIDAASGEITFTNAGSFTVTYTTAGACPDVQTFSLSVIDCTTCTPPAPPVVVAGSLTVCAGLVNTQPFVVTAPANAYIQWYNSAGLPIATGENFVPTLPGTYTAQSVETGNDLCVSASIAATLTELPADDPSFAYGSTAYCIGEPNPVPVSITTPGGTFTASGGLLINFNTGEIDLNSALGGGSFVITYLTAGVCPDTANVTINISGSNVGVEAGSDITVCEGETINLNGTLTSGFGEVNWTTASGNGVFTTPASLSTGFTPSQTGTFMLYITAQDACGNMAADSLLLTIQPQVVVSVTGQSNIQQGQSTQLTASGALGYIWQNHPSLSCTDCPNPVVTPTQTTTYTVSATDACSEPVSFTVIVLPAVDKVIAPNAFSPNGDGVNEVFRVFSSAELGSFSMQVFNRWGNLVFETDNPAEGWNGTYKGEAQELGVYVYQIRYTFATGGSEKVLKGNVTLVK